MNNDNNFKSSIAGLYFRAGHSNATAPSYYIFVSEYVECTSDNSSGVVSTGFSKVSTISDDDVSGPLAVNRLKNENEGVKTYALNQLLSIQPIGVTVFLFVFSE